MKFRLYILHTGVEDSDYETLNNIQKEDILLSADEISSYKFSTKGDIPRGQFIIKGKILGGILTEEESLKSDYKKLIDNLISNSLELNNVWNQVPKEYLERVKNMIRTKYSMINTSPKAINDNIEYLNHDNLIKLKYWNQDFDKSVYRTVILEIFYGDCTRLIIIEKAFIQSYREYSNSLNGNGELEMIINEFKYKDKKVLSFISDKTGEGIPITPNKKVLSKREDRKTSILNNSPAIFNISETKGLNGKIPKYSLDIFDEVDLYENIIEKVAKEYNLDSDLVKAITYIETTQGYYDRFNLMAKNFVKITRRIPFLPIIISEIFGINQKISDKIPDAKSYRPMNLFYKEWEELCVENNITELDLIKSPEKNIRLACILLKRIEERIPNPTIEKIATVYNFLGAEETREYGARVKQIYLNKEWKKTDSTWFNKGGGYNENL